MQITDLPSEFVDRLPKDIVDKILEYAQDPEPEAETELDGCESFEQKLERQFPNCPFHISCFRCFCVLDRMFVRKKTVIIYDDRAAYDWYFDEEDTVWEMRSLNRSRSSYLHYTVVHSPTWRYITMRDILRAMSADPHYSEDIVRDNPHRFLEGFARMEDNDEVYKHPCFSCSWGS